tara:strand:+ start:669 stop:866 length:198 start_codon:yes stop_codon:yes gene_type:complete
LEQESGVYALELSIATDSGGDIRTYFSKDDLYVLLSNGSAFKNNKCSQSHHKLLSRIHDFYKGLI